MNYLKIIFLMQFLTKICAEQQCDSTALRKFDTDVAKLIAFGSSGRKFPENNGQDFKIFCNQSYEYTANIESYKKRCFTNLPRQVASIIIYAVKNTLKQQCKKPNSKIVIELVSSTPCINTANSEFNKCYQDYIESLQGAKYAAESKRIPHLCCEFHKFLPCFQERTLSYPVCSRKRVEVISNYVLSIFGNMIDFLCGDYTENSDKCDKLEPPPKKKRNDLRSKSFAVPLIQLLDSFPEI